MKITGRLSVIDCNPVPGDLTLSVDQATFSELVKTIEHSTASKTFSLRDGKYGRSFQWDFVIGEEITRKVFLMILKNVGLRPSPTVKRKPPDGYFFQVLRRVYTKSELDTFDFFTLFPHRWIASMGDRATISDPVSVKDDRVLKKRLPIGFIDPHQVLAVSGIVKGVIEACSGASFDPIRIEGSDRFSDVFLLRSKTVLPSCLLDVVTAYGEPYQPGGRGCLFEGGPFDVPELAFDRSEFPGSDVSVTQELIGLSEFDRFPIVVMAQSVRAKLLGLAIKGMDFLPVRLVSKGEPRWQDPWVDIFGEKSTD